jgi:hypothetical protein
LREAAAASSDGRSVVFPAATAAADAQPEQKGTPTARGVTPERLKNDKK